MGLFWQDVRSLFFFRTLWGEGAALAAAMSIKSFVSTERSDARPGNPRMNAYAGYAGEEEIRSETKRWYQAPSQWRTEGSGETVDAQRKQLPNRDWSGISVGDGKDAWHYDAKANAVTVNELGVAPSGKTDSYGG